jgi:hypothetical protein
MSSYFDQKNMSAPTPDSAPAPENRSPAAEIQLPPNGAAKPPKSASPESQHPPGLPWRHTRTGTGASPKCITFYVSRLTPHASRFTIQPCNHVTMRPLIIDPTRRPLPQMSTLQDAAKLNLQEKTTFFVSAFLFQGWVSELNLASVALLAEKPDPNDRSFQTGQAWSGFRKYFGRASDAEFPEIFSHVMQFAECDDPLADQVFDAIAPLSIEHEITGNFLGRRTPASFRTRPKELLALMRATTTRLCDWLDALCHLRVFLQWHIMPDCFDPDPQKRELASLGVNHRQFEFLNEKSQLHHLDHMADLVDELKNSPQWAAYRQVAFNPAPAPRPWPSQHFDTAIIKVWPLLLHYRWTGADLLWVLRQFLAPDALSVCPDQPALADYCARTLGLRSPLMESLRRHNPEPLAFQVAKRFLSPSPEEDSQP